MTEPKNVCESWVWSIRQGIKIALENNPDGRLTPEQVKEFRSRVDEDILHHKNIDRLMHEIAIEDQEFSSGIFRERER